MMVLKLSNVSKKGPWIWTTNLLLISPLVHSFKWYAFRNPCFISLKCMVKWNAGIWVCKPHLYICEDMIPDSKVHGANMGPSWGRQDPELGGPHIDPVNFAVWENSTQHVCSCLCVANKGGPLMIQIYNLSDIWGPLMNETYNTLIVVVFKSPKRDLRWYNGHIPLGLYRFIQYYLTETLYSFCLAKNYCPL